MLRRQFKKFGDVVTDIDMFSKPVQFSFDHGKTEYSTVIGAITTIIYLSSILSYALFKLANMSKFSDANVTNSVIPDYYNSEFRYNAGSDSFAFGITGF
jgi:uncharacterized metal-binding protein